MAHFLTTHAHAIHRRTHAREHKPLRLQHSVAPPSASPIPLRPLEAGPLNSRARGIFRSANGWVPHHADSPDARMHVRESCTCACTQVQRRGRGREREKFIDNQDGWPQQPSERRREVPFSCASRVDLMHVSRPQSFPPPLCVCMCE